MSDAPRRRLVLLRHGETAWSLAGRHTGRTDVELTDAGRVQARGAGERLAGMRFERVLTSPLVRARETCRLAGFEGEADARLLEWDYGDYDGRTTSEIREQRPGWSLWEDGSPGGEDAADVAARADALIAEATAEPGGDWLLVAHGHLLRVLGARWIEQPPQLGARLLLGTAAICVLGHEREARALERWNETGEAG